MKKAWILLLLSLHLGAFSPEESERFPAAPSPEAPLNPAPPRLYEAHGIDSPRLATILRTPPSWRLEARKGCMSARFSARGAGM